MRPARIDAPLLLRLLKVWASSTVDFLSEWRCYVLKGVVLAAVCYAGDEGGAPLDRAAVDAAVQTLFRNAQQGSHAFAADFGVIRPAAKRSPPRLETVLIEVNDGYSVGFYPPCPPAVYTDVLLGRWGELVASPPAM